MFLPGALGLWFVGQNDFACVRDRPVDRASGRVRNGILYEDVLLGAGIASHLRAQFRGRPSTASPDCRSRRRGCRTSSAGP